jgi:hypothetical protein
MLAPYANASTVNNSIATKLNIADTATMLNDYARAQRMIDSLSLVQSRLNLKLNLSDTAAMLAPYANASTVNNSIATKLNISDTANMLSSYARAQRMIDSLSLVQSRLDLKLNIADTAAMLAPYLTRSSVSSTYLPLAGGTLTGGLNGTNASFTGKVGIETTTPSSLFQIGSEGNFDLNLKFDNTDNVSALKFGYRAYQWRMKTSTNSGVLTPLIFSFYNGTTDADKLTISESGADVTGNVNITGNLKATSTTLSDLNVNSGQLFVDKTNNRVSFFTSNPTSLFQVGGESNTDLNLKYDFDPNNSSALKFGYRQYQWRIKTSTNSGVLLPLVFSYFNGTTDVDILQIGTTGGITASSFVKSGGTSSQYLMADGSVSSGPATINDATDEFTATVAQTSFTLTQTPSTYSKVKMYINGIRISNSAYSWSGKTLTYDGSKNGAYSLTASDRIQFDYFY